MQGKDFELGIYTFAELTPDPDTGRVVTPAELMRAIELFGTEVAPVVRAELSRRAERPAPVA